VVGDQWTIPASMVVERIAAVQRRATLDNEHYCVDIQKWKEVSVAL